MKILVQRVDEASVSVEGEKISEIGKGLLLLVGFSKNYSEEKLEYLTKKFSSSDFGLLKKKDLT